VFALSAAFAVMSIIAVLSIPARVVDYHHARGLVRGDSGHPDRKTDLHASKLRLLLHCHPLLLLAAALALFNLGNSALLPLFSQAIVAYGHGNPSTVTAQTIIISQLVMLPLRGFVAGTVAQTWGIWPVQTFDGIAAGLQSAVAPAMVVDLLHGSGYVNLGQGVDESGARRHACRTLRLCHGVLRAG